MNPYRDGTRIHVTWPNGNEATGPVTLMDNAAWVQVAGTSLLIDDDCSVEVLP